MIQALVNLIFYIIQLIANIVLAPIMNLLTTMFPDISTYTGYVSNFLTNYLFKYLAFAKSMFMNITGFPQFLFNALVGYIIIKISINVAMQSYKLIMNMWRLFKP